MKKLKKKKKGFVIGGEKTSSLVRFERWKKAICAEFFSAPFFIVWAFFIGLLANSVESELLNSFFFNALAEGVAIKSLMLMLVLSTFNLGCVFIFNPKSEGRMMKVLCSPFSVARAICVATGANILGILIAMFVSEGPGTITGQVAMMPISIILIWAGFAAFEIFSVDCAAFRNEMRHWAIFSGHLLLAVFGISVYYTYRVILSGAFS